MSDAGRPSECAKRTIFSARASSGSIEVQKTAGTDAPAVISPECCILSARTYTKGGKRTYVRTTLQS